MIIQRTNARSISELFDKCEYYEWQNLTLNHPNYHELIKTALELHVKLNLDKQRSNLWKFAIDMAVKYALDPQQVQIFDYIFTANNIHPKEFAICLKKILEKQEFKINTLRIVGLPNTCKTLISNCIVEPFICCRMNNKGSENEFYLSNMLNKSIIQCEELYLTVATAEDFKSILGGQNLDIDKKYNDKQMLIRTPVIITTNYERFGRGHIPPLDESALASRCFSFRMNNPYRPPCKLDWHQLYLYLLSYLE